MALAVSRLLQQALQWGLITAWFLQCKPGQECVQAIHPKTQTSAPGYKAMLYLAGIQSFPTSNLSLNPLPNISSGVFYFIFWPWCWQRQDTAPLGLRSHRPPPLLGGEPAAEADPCSIQYKLCKAQPRFITHQVTEGVITNYIKHIIYF